MDNEKILTPKESLGLIADAISRTRDNFRENSFGFLLWGWLIATASFACFLLHRYTTLEYYFIPFPISGATGIIVTILYFRRRHSSGTLSYTTWFIHKMWAALGISFLMVVFINLLQGEMPFTYTLIIAGTGTLVSGWVMKFKPLVIGGILFLVAAIASVFVYDEYKPLLHGIAIVAGYIVPGYLLKKVKPS